MNSWDDLKKEGDEKYIILKEEVDGIDEWVWREGDEGGFFHPTHDWPSIRDKILKYTKGRELIVQAGGCCGMYPRLWSKYFNIVHTFEPVDNNFHALCANCPSDNIHKHHAALGEVEGFVRMVGGKEHDPVKDKRFKNVGVYWVHLHKLYDSGVYQMPLDKLRLPHVDAIQLDVEKYETRILKGAVETIRRYKPTICIETYDEEAAEFLYLMGYELVDRAERDHILISKL